MADFDDTAPLDALSRDPTGRRPRLRGWPLALVVVWLALAIFDIMSVAPFSPASSHQSAKAAGPGGTGRNTNSGRQTSGHHKHPGTHTPSPSPSARPSVLAPVSVSAFGPTGT